MSESLGLTSHKSSCNCTGCGLLRAGVCINCAEKIAALILESSPGELSAEPCSGACREAIVLLHAARALARAASAVAVGPTVTAATPRSAIGEAACALSERCGNQVAGRRTRTR